MISIDLMSVPEAQDLLAPNAVLIWQTLSGMFKGPAEADFIRGVVGEDVVRANEIASNELSTLLSILSDMRDGHSLAATSSSPARLHSTAHKDLLQDRLRQLLTHMRTQSPTMDAMFKTPREKKVAEFVIDGCPAGSANRPSSGQGLRACSSLSRSLDSRPTSAGWSSRSSTSTSTNLEELQRNIRFDLVHEVAPQLIELFKQEHDAIVEDINYVRSLIDDEVNVSRFAEPTEKELKELTKRVEQEQEQKRHEELIRSLPGPEARKTSLPTLQKLPRR